MAQHSTKFLPKGVHWVPTRTATGLSHAHPATLHSPQRLVSPVITDDGRYALIDGDLETRWEQLQQVIQGSFGAKPVSITLTDNRKILISARGKMSPTVRLRLHWGFLRFGEATWKDIAGFLLYRQEPPQFRRVIQTFGPRFPHPLLRVEARQLPPAKRRHYNLQEIYDRLNRDYFSGALVAQIGWGKPRRAGRTIKLGRAYQSLGRIVMHPILDDPRVPSYFLDLIVFHEMLHIDIATSHILFPPQVLPQQTTFPFSRGDLPRQWRLHPRIFRVREEGFPDYRSAKQWEQANIGDLTRRWNQSWFQGRDGAIESTDSSNRGILR